mmetsp:Transcript_5846/g.14299  ORF Transcript_5846/g.14299 Transcript_5846/m.14299 type:complete len:834 (+) Transcript_5846:1651-4152(+)
MGGGKKKRERMEKTKKKKRQAGLQSMKSMSDTSALGSRIEDDDEDVDPSLQEDDQHPHQEEKPVAATATTAINKPKTRNNKRFTARELSRLKAYLMEYKRIILDAIRDVDGDDLDNGSWFSWMGRRSSLNHVSNHFKSANTTAWDFTTTETRIGGVVFPPLARVVGLNNNTRSNGNGTLNGISSLPLHLLTPPYLCLSSELSAKQRRDVHRLAMEVGLFHCGYGGGNDNVDRFVAISFFSDGLEFLESALEKRSEREDCSNDDLDDPADDNDDINTFRPFVPVQKYKPWICRSNTETINRVHETKQGKEIVYQLVDQPSMCLRDDIDRLDLDEMKGEDLSHRSSLGIVSKLGVDDVDDVDDDNDSFLLVNSVERMHRCLEELRRNRPSELAFDVECYNKSKYVQVTCLLQLSTNHGKDYVIDVLADDGNVWNMVKGLAEFFADPSIVKIGHAIGGLDVQCLHRDFGIFVVNAFDTYVAASMIPKLSRHGLAKVCRSYGLPQSDDYEGLKEQYQNSDWTRRPLPYPAVLYARYDVHYLIDLRKLLMRDLVEADGQPYPETIDHSKANNEFVSTGGINTMKDMLRSFNEEDGIEDEFDCGNLDLSFLIDDDDIDTNTQHTNGTKVESNGYVPKSILDAKDLRMNLALMAAISKSQDACLGLWKTTVEPAQRNTEYQSMIVQASKDGDPWIVSQMNLYEKMANWRQMVAEKEECLAGFVCTLEFLACVAYKRPRSEIELRQITWHLPHLLEEQDGRHAREMLIMVQESRSKDLSVAISPFYSYKEYQEKLLNGSIGGRGRHRNTDNGHYESYWVVASVITAAIATGIVVRQFGRRT